nr:retrotransposon Orf1 [Tanacetum cinerariifolium]
MGEQREISLLQLGWRVGLYTERKSRDNATLNGFSRAETMKENHLLMEFWLSIGDSRFNVGNTNVASIRNPRVKLAYRYIATTILGRKESTHRVTEIDLYYLYFIYMEGVVCNIPYWLSKYLKSVRDKSLICGGMPATRAIEEDEAKEEAKREATNMGAGGFAEMHQNTSKAIGRFVKHDGWTNKTNVGSNLMFSGDSWRRKAGYPPCGYHGHMPPGYAYRPGPSHDGSS